MSELQNRKTYYPGDAIIEEGSDGSVLYIIEKGKVEIWKRHDTKKKLVLGHLSDGQIFGEMSIIDNSPRAASVSALETTTVIKVDGGKLLEALKGCPPVITTILKTLILDLKRSTADLSKAHEHKN